MKLGSRRAIHRTAGTVVACLLAISLAHGQAGAGEKSLTSDQAFKNIQVLRGIPVKEFMETMGFFAASLSLNCTDCHGEASASDWANYAVDTPLKQTARRMVVMVNAINKADFGGTRSVTCYTCHRGSEIPKVIPSLAAQYAAPPDEDPDEVEIIAGTRVTATPDQILAKYTQALGGAAALGKLKSYTGKGTYMGFDSDFEKVPVDVYAKAPGMRAVVAHMASGDSSNVTDGKSAWQAAPSSLAPVPVLTLGGDDLQGAILDGALMFPADLKNSLTDWKVGFPATTIKDKPVDVVEATAPGGARIKLYFDKQTGLLVRQVRYSHTAVGIVATHVEYGDYRPVAGVKLPYHWVLTWVDGQSTVDLSAIQPNAAVDDSKFSMPAPPVNKLAAK